MICRIKGQKHYIMVANKYFENVKKLKYLGKKLASQNCIHEEIKSRLNAGNACYHVLQDVQPSRLLSKNVKIKIYVFCIRVKPGL
jgi:hypothetical protein